jgi:hypothetical protein
MASTTSSSCSKAVPERAHRLRAALIVLGLLAPGACRKDPESPLAAEARAAVARSVEALLRESAVEAGTLHAAMALERQRPDPRLAQWIAGHRKLLREDLFIRLLDPGAPALELPERFPPGFQGLTWILAASIHGPDTDFPRPELVRYLAEDLHGYGLTHQIWALEWALSVGRRLPPDLHRRREELRRRLLAEVEAAPRFSDLLAESLHLLLAYEPPLAVGEAAIRALLAGQVRGGQFHDATVWRLRHDGDVRELEAAPAHTTAHAAAALAAWLEVRGP